MNTTISGLFKKKGKEITSRILCSRSNHGSTLTDRQINFTEYTSPSHTQGNRGSTDLPGVD